MKSLENVNSPSRDKVWKMHACARTGSPLRSPGRSGRVRFPLLLKFGNCGNLWKWIGLDLRLSWHPAKLPPTLSVNYQCSALTNRCSTAFWALIDGPLLKNLIWGLRIRFFHFFLVNILLTKVCMVKLYRSGAAHVTQVLELWHLVKFLGQADSAFQKKVVNFQLSDISDFAFWTPSFTNGKKIENFPQTTFTHHLVHIGDDGAVGRKQGNSKGVENILLVTDERCFEGSHPCKIPL